MRVRILLLFIVVCFFSCNKEKKAKNNFDCIDEKACAEFEKKLKLIHDWNFLLKEIDNEELMKVGAFLDSITGIESTADMSYDGLGFPTELDYNNWSVWYSINYNCLEYTPKDSILSIDKECVSINEEKFN